MRVARRFDNYAPTAVAHRRLTLGLLVLLCYYSRVTTVTALFAEDAGKLDFLIATTGHGPVESVHTASGAAADGDDDVLITASSSSCHVASRSITTGALLWRRNVCGASLDLRSTSVTVVGTVVVTADASGTVRGWNVQNGALLWDYTTTSSSTAQIGCAVWTVNDQVVAVASSSSDENSLTILNAKTGRVDNSISKTDAQAAKPKEHPDETKNSVTCGDLKISLEEGGSGVVVVKNRSAEDDDEDGAPVVVASLVSGGAANYDKVSLLKCEETKSSFVLLLTSKRGTTTQVTSFLDSSSSSLDKKDKLQIMWTAQEGLAQISSALMLDASHDQDVVAIQKHHENNNLLDLSSRLELQYKSLSSKMSLLWSLSPEQQQQRDYDFGFFKIAVLLADAPIHRIFGLATTTTTTTSSSSSSSGGEGAMRIRYQIDLPENAVWHRLVHGSTNSAKSTHGIHGVVHTREVLVLSLVDVDGQQQQQQQQQQRVEWLCMEGTSGKVSAKGSVAIAGGDTTVIQVIALAGQGACRQGALLMLEDKSLVSVPPPPTTADDETTAVVLDSPLYAHALDKNKAGLESFRILPSSNKDGGGGGLESHLIGSAAFAGEEIVAVSYPIREEVVQSPCNVLGDDSLLLKYLNPHLVVILTMGSSNNNEDGDEKSFSLAPNKKSTSQKRKPLGVTPTGGQEVPKVEQEKPNLFVNLVDTVSGRIIHRSSHANALSTPRPSILISENWVFYTFTNAKTKKAELGVLSLYEGMIDSKGLTAFTSPEQSTSFSSFDARETKPVVLAKTFSIPCPITALGMTTTRAGISSRRLLLAGIDGQLHAIDRKILEPRRPMGQLKDSEKKEGLLQYHELIQTVSYLSLSYNQTVEAVRSIITAPTDLESQTLVLAFGGPDIFFARTSPSRGFDLLPDSFNKIALSIVVAGLVAALVVMRRMVSKKIKNQGWV